MAFDFVPNSTRGKGHPCGIGPGGFQAGNTCHTLKGGGKGKAPAAAAAPAKPEAAGSGKDRSKPKERTTQAKRTRIEQKLAAAREQAHKNPDDDRAQALAKRFRGKDILAAHLANPDPKRGGLFKQLRDKRLAQQAANGDAPGKAPGKPVQAGGEPQTWDDSTQSWRFPRPAGEPQAKGDEKPAAKGPRVIKLKPKTSAEKLHSARIAAKLQAVERANYNIQDTANTDDELGRRLDHHAGVKNAERIAAFGGGPKPRDFQPTTRDQIRTYGQSADQKDQARKERDAAALAGDKTATTLGRAPGRPHADEPADATPGGIGVPGLPAIPKKGVNVWQARQMMAHVQKEFNKERRKQKRNPTPEGVEALGKMAEMQTTLARLANPEGAAKADAATAPPEAKPTGKRTVAERIAARGDIDDTPLTPPGGSAPEPAPQATPKRRTVADTLAEPVNLRGKQMTRGEAVNTLRAEGKTERQIGDILPPNRRPGRSGSLDEIGTAAIRAATPYRDPHQEATARASREGYLRDRYLARQAGNPAFMTPAEIKEAEGIIARDKDKPKPETGAHVQVASDLERHFADADAADGGNNFVKLSALRKRMDHVPRDVQDKAIKHLQKTGKLSLNSHDGRYESLSPEDKAAAIEDASGRLVYASRGDEGWGKPRKPSENDRRAASSVEQMKAAVARRNGG